MEARAVLTEYQQDLMDTWVKEVQHMKMGHKMTVVHLTLKNGYEVVGTAGCEDPSKFNYELGKHFATVDALNKINPLVSFLKQSTPEVLRIDQKMTDEQLDALRKAVSEGFIQVIRDSQHTLFPFGR